MAHAPLRLACLGDSWVAAWTEDENKELRRIVTPMPDAVRVGLTAREQQVELLVAGFPGSTTERLLDLVQICRLRDMELMSQRGYSIKGDLVRRLEKYDIPFLTTANESASLKEDVDIVLVAVGSNDLSHKDMSQEILGRLFKLREIYAERGVDVLLVSLGGVGPEEAGKPESVDLEANRLCVNRRLLQQDWVFSYDDLMKGVDSSMWADGWHLNEIGSRVYGDRLAEAVTLYLQRKASNLSQGPSELRYSEGDVLCVSRCNDDAVSNTIAGIYLVGGVNHGRPVFKKQSAAGSGDVVIFYWDERNGTDYFGWWFGPEIGWDHPGWARNTTSTNDKLPLTGWRVPPAEEDDKGLVITYRTLSELEPDLRSAKKPPVVVHVGNCKNALVSDVIAGDFIMHGVNHGKPIYKKQSTTDLGDVLLFFWDARTGPQWSGWWISPKVGSWTHPGWARHRDVLSATPPEDGWHIPPYKSVDESFRLSFSDNVPSMPSEMPCKPLGSEPAPGDLQVSACEDEELAKVLEGRYTASAENHGKPIYRKMKDDGSLDEVHLFFCNARGGVMYAGWWFSRACGDWSHPGWAHNEGAGQGGAPPETGWLVPTKGSVGMSHPQDLDKTMRVTTCQQRAAGNDTNSAIKCAQNSCLARGLDAVGNLTQEPPLKVRKQD